MHFHSLIEGNFRLIESHKKALKKLGIKTIGDLLYHFPVRYGDTSEKRNIGTLALGEKAVIFGKISRLKTSKGFKSKIPMSEAWIEDESGTIKAVWFHQPYIAKMIHENAFVRADGKVSDRKGELYLSNPKIETIVKLPIGVGDSLFGGKEDPHSLYPVYPESKGISSNWFYHTIQKIFSSGILDNIQDPIPEYILKTYNLPSLKTALVWIHTPQKQDDALSARKRFAFEEVFFIQLQKKREKILWNKNPSYVIEKTPKDIAQFVERFPFAPTEAQNKAIEQIMNDFRSGHAMSRLLEGDVGSGKTAVAAATAYSIVTSKPKGQTFGNLQVAYMAPTEILAKQHFESFIEYFTYLKINVGLITGKECRKFPSKVNPKQWTKISKPQLLKWVANGEIPILIGTHALISKSVKFKHLAYSIIDEQHRFGTAQRQKITRKEGLNPHLLSMTATPIPRTLALTIYGDLDLTLLDQMPLGRKPIITEIVLPAERENTYTKIKEKLIEGRQVYVICPRIDVPDPEKESAIIAKSVKEEAERLKKDIFPNYEIGILHSKMLQGEKEEVMDDFKSGKIKILVATSVVEVGVNVPNATVIILEGAERFGLAQLHQLRGRVIRSNHQAYCYVFAETKTEKTLQRLNAFKNSSNGFELAEFDLKLRGPGELSGNKQWGISDIGMEAIRNLKMVEAARSEAEYLLSQDETLGKYPLINEKLSHRKTDEIHFE
ncbi:MAG: ATP-dependent DNA helicase RecG [Candidatus Paceibacterota bacterium]|jgi:ATP-dependent DNA helicase RecG